VPTGTGSKSGRRKFFGDGLVHRFGQRSRSAGLDRAGRDVGCVAVAVNLGPENRNLFRGFNPDLDSVPVNSGDFDED